MPRIPLIFCAVLSLAVASAAPSSPDYARDIQPIFQKRCYVCHGPQVQTKGLRFDDRQAAMRVIASGDSAHSLLIAMVTGAGGKVMPPSGPRLSESEVALLRAWVDHGAPWPDSYERLVDRLLASPHYGEKWARYWLDLAHYADSDGYEKDLERPWAWRYRKWVINALNRDLPYDQFAIEQIAGDELPGASVEQMVATGFFRQTLTNREGGVDRHEARFEELIDRTGTFGT